MLILEFLRQFRIGEYAIFDLAVSFLGIYLLSPGLSQWFKSRGITTSRKNWLLMTLPLGVMVHFLFGINTQMIKDLGDTKGHFLIKLIIVGLLFLGLRGIKLVRRKFSIEIVLAFLIICICLFIRVMQLTSHPTGPTSVFGVCPDKEIHSKKLSGEEMVYWQCTSSHNPTNNVDYGVMMVQLIDKRQNYPVNDEDNHRNYCLSYKLKNQDERKDMCFEYFDYDQFVTDQAKNNPAWAKTTPKEFFRMVNKKEKPWLFNYVDDSVFVRIPIPMGGSITSFEEIEKVFVYPYKKVEEATDLPLAPNKYKPIKSIQLN